jgi:hypothetical protein
MRQKILAAVVLLAACGPALPPPRPLRASDTNPEDKVVCQDERTTGTNMSRSVCLTPDQINENRRAAQEWEKHPRNSVTNAK